MPPNLEPVDGVRIIGHRGAMAHAPENSMESFTKALEMGVDALEMDVRVTKDGVPVLIHDDRLESTSDGRGLVSETSFESLKTCKLRNGEAIPSLSEVLGEFEGRCGFIIDFKDERGLDTVYKNVVDTISTDEVLFSSFDGTQLMGLKLKYHRARTAFICDDRKMQMLTISDKIKAEALHVSRRLCKPELVNDAHSRGLDIVVWTVNKPRHMKKFIEMGVDGIVTDKPGDLKDILG